MRLGAQVSVARGLVSAAAWARRLGCECIQLFARNPRGWRGRDLPEEEVAEFLRVRARWGIEPVIIHAPYVVNLASPDPELRHRSVRCVADDMARAARVGACWVVAHPGHHMGAGMAMGIKMLGESLRSLLADGPEGVGVVLENTAGRGSELGRRWQELAWAVEEVAGDERVGLCLDTCHAHAAGYRLDSAQWVGRTLGAFRAALGRCRLRLVHLNDCRGPAGARQDLHQHIGRGTIGERGFRALLRRRELQGRCAILETPLRRPGDDRQNLARVRGLMATGS